MDSNASSAVAAAVDPNVSSAVAGSKSGPRTQAQRKAHNPNKHREEYYEPIAWDSSMYTEDEYRQWYGTHHCIPLYEAAPATPVSSVPKPAGSVPTSTIASNPQQPATGIQT